MLPTVGIEVEFEGVAEHGAKPMKERFPVKVFDDRSSRGATFQIDGIPARLQKRRDGEYIMPSGVEEARAIGLELISEPMEEDMARDFCRTVANLYGHVPQTLSTSIHIHMDVANKPWTYIQRLVSWCYYLEAVLYRMAAAGGTHRGCRPGSNDYKYARPLSSSIGVFLDRVVRPMIDMSGVLNARSWSEMLAHWGRLDWVTNSEHRGSHYLPHRLSGFSLHSVVRQGTFEFRLFDAVYYAVPSMLELVYALHRLADNPDEKFPVRPYTIRKEPWVIDTGWLHEKLGDEPMRLWSESAPWPQPVRKTAMLHHYTDRFSANLPSLQREDIHWYTNNNLEFDRGLADFVPYRR